MDGKNRNKYDSNNPEMQKRYHFKNTENVRRIQSKVGIRKFRQRRIRAEIAEV